LQALLGELSPAARAEIERVVIEKGLAMTQRPDLGADDGPCD